MYGLTLVTPSLTDPVSLAQVKQFCTVADEFTDDDVLLTGFISAATNEAEKYTRRAFYTQTWRLALDYFPMYWGQSTIKSAGETFSPYSFLFDQMTIRLPKPRCISVDSITYIDQTGTQQTLPSNSYIVDTDSEPARLIPYPGAYWPGVTAYVPGNVKITFTCGSYGDGVDVDNCPGTVKTAVSILAAHFYANREGNVPIPDAFYRLLDGERHEVFGYGH